MPVVHQLHVVVAGAEQISELRGTGERVVIAAQPQVGLHLSARASGGGDQSARVPGEQFAIDTRLVEVALQRRQRAQPEQVVHAGGVLCPHRQVSEGAATANIVRSAVTPEDPSAFGSVSLRGEIGLDANDRLHR